MPDFFLNLPAKLESFCKKLGMSQKVEQENLSSEVSEISIDPEKFNKNENDKPEQFNSAEASSLQKIIRKDPVENKNDIEIQRKDLNSPLISVKTFEALNLKPNLLKGAHAMGFKAPFKIQETVLPSLLANPPQNLIVQSQPGTGKTATFVLAMLSRVNPEKDYPQALCLLPMYELAIQTGRVAAKMAQFCPEISIKLAVRGEEVTRNIKIKDHIIIGTPGKFLDWGVKFRLFDLSKISVFVLNEADYMIGTQGHQDQCIRIHKCLGRKCQMMLFSATYDNDIIEFSEVFVPNLLIIRLKQKQESLDNIKQYYVRCANQQEKYIAVTTIFGVLGVGQCIIFCHTRRKAAWLAEKMSKNGHAVALLTGELTVEQRVSVLDHFRASQEKILITTNILPRGIHVEQVTIVINFDLPIDINGKANCEIYLQRIGTIGRFGKSGVAINLVESPVAMEICQTLEAQLGKKINYLDAEDSDEIEKIGTQP